MNKHLVQIVYRVMVFGTAIGMTLHFNNPNYLWLIALIIFVAG